MGRKNKYETHVLPHLGEIPKWYETMTEGQIASKLGVSSSSWENYKHDYPELTACLRQGKEILVDELKATLRKKALGFEYDEIREKSEPDGFGRMVVTERTVTRKFVVPDLGSIHLLLKNLDDNWHNDDKATLDLKREQLEVTKRKAESENWIMSEDETEV